MKNLNEWSNEDFLTYLYIYVADSDLIINDDEKDFILSRVSSDQYEKVFKTYKKHKDVEKLEVISDFCKRNCKTAEEKDKLIIEIKNLYWADDEFNAVEKAYFIALKRLISSIK